MAEQTFRSPGFFDQEIDLSGRQVASTGIPAGVVGTAQKGPAFVPVTVGSFADFETKFGTLDAKRFGPYAVQKWLDNRTACTYVRVLGAGSNETEADIGSTRTAGIVANAGFKLEGSASPNAIPGETGVVQFLVAKHDAVANETAGFPVFSDNSSIGNASSMNLVRGVIFTASGTRLQLLDNNAAYSGLSDETYDVAKVGAIAGSALSANKYFKIVVSGSGAAFGTAESQNGIRILTASLDPNDGAYVGKVLNTDPLRFQQEQHLLYLDFAVEHDLAPVISTTVPTVALVSGTTGTSSTSGLSSTQFNDLFGRFDTRYMTPRTTSFISQPFGQKEYDLFHFETIDDGAYANEKFKVSIAGLVASTNEKQPYGSFEVQVRAFDDSDTNSAILERYPNCSLDPKSDRYVARLIGDKKIRFDFDQEDPDERRLVVTGKYPNVSQRVRIVMNEQVDKGTVPKVSLPFGFRGAPVLKTSDSLTDNALTALAFGGQTFGATASRRLFVTASAASAAALTLSSSIVPPLPYRVKVTRGAVAGSGFLGNPGAIERVDGRFYWGVKTDPVPVDSTNDSVIGIANAVLNPNVGAGINPLVRAYTKFQGIEKTDTLVTGSAKDAFNSNKFTLARVALYNAATALSDVTTQVTASAGEHMLQAAYVRDGNPNSTTYTVSDGTISNRITFASLIATSSALFNRFTEYHKFTNIFYGGFDGVNILDEDQSYFRDRALSSDTGGKNPTSGVPNIGLLSNVAGVGRRNNQVYSLRKAIDIITNPVTSKVNLLAVPGVRDSYVTDHAADSTKGYGLAMYVMDIVEYDKDGNRLYDDSTGRSNVAKTIAGFDTRQIDNNYAAAYFPDVKIQDTVNNKVVQVPPSVAAFGALGFNDKTQQVWFAPAGFNRGALDFVSNAENRLSSADRDSLYDARINPIATFPRAGFVIFGQKTLQVAQSALDRINVRRMMLDIKRRIGGIARGLVFEQNNSTTRARFVAQAVQELTFVQAAQGVEAFRVICDETNNTAADIEQNRMRGQITVVPTRAVEFIAVDFIITNSGVSFE
jgi:hypothetical protein